MDRSVGLHLELRRPRVFRSIVFIVTLSCCLIFVCPASEVGLSLRRAIQLALSTSGDARIQLIRELREETQSQVARARTALLPNIEGYAAYQQQTRNLQAFGFKPDPRLAFFSFFVGPFATIDLRASLTQNIFDLAAVKHFQASKVAAKAIDEETVWKEDQVAADTARLYIEVLRTRKQVETSEAAVALAQALLDLAQTQKRAGTGTAIEVTRARVQLANEKQLQVAAHSADRQARLRLARVLGVDFDQPVRLTDSLGYPPSSYDPVGRVVEDALNNRKDLRLQREKVRASELDLAASRWRRAPSLVGFADYGTIGTDTGAKLPTWTAGVSLRIPIFDGGLMEAAQGERASKLRQERIKLSDLEREIELQVRLAYEAMVQAGGEVKVAEEGMGLANLEMAQARRRYGAGVATGLEVTDAQTRLRRAENNLTASLARFNLARIELWHASGTLRDRISP